MTIKISVPREIYGSPLDAAISRVAKGWHSWESSVDLFRDSHVFVFAYLDHPTDEPY